MQYGDFSLKLNILLSRSSLSGARLNTTCETTVSIPEDSDEHQEVIEVQILPQVTQFLSVIRPSLHSLYSLSRTIWRSERVVLC